MNCIFSKSWNSLIIMNMVFSRIICELTGGLVFDVKCQPMKAGRFVWVFHPSKPCDTVAIGRAGQHWRNAKRKLILDMENAKWSTYMQQVTIDNVYKNFDE